MSRDNSYMIGNQWAKGNAPNKTSFRKGLIPWNKGSVGLIKPNSGSFQRYQRPATWKPVGTLTIRKDKSGAKRRWIKTEEPKTWMEYAKFLWLKSGRSIKKSYVLHHSNNDSFDDRLENYILVSRSNHVKLHNRWNTKNVIHRKIALPI